MILQSKLLALLNEVLGQNAKVRKGGNEASYFCCFCNHYKRKLEFNLETGQWSCWVCHARGSYIGSFLTKIKAPKRYRDQAFELTKDVRLQRKNRKTTDEVLALPEEFLTLTEPRNTPEFKHAMLYLKERRITPEDICRYNIGYCERGEFANCIIVPSYDAEGKLNFYSSRFFYKNWIKYKNPSFSRNVIGFEAFINFDEPVTLVEGVFDAIAVRKNAIPLFGTVPSSRLKEVLVVSKPPRVNIVLDNDAMKCAIHTARSLMKWGLVVHVVSLPVKDPSELGFDRVHDLIENSKPLDFKEMVYQRLME